MLPSMCGARLFIVKSRPVIMKISTVCNKISNFHNNKTSNCYHENKYQLLSEMAFLNIVKFLKLKSRVITCRSCFIHWYNKKTFQFRELILVFQRNVRIHLYIRLGSQENISEQVQWKQNLRCFTARSGKKLHH